MSEGKSAAAHTIRLRAGRGDTHPSATMAAVVTFSCMLTDPRGAPMMAPTRSPTSRGISHQRSSQARTPRVDQARAYSASDSAARRGIAPSELLIM